ncbi:formyl-coenzyme A transferase [compost metagenome]
MLGLQNEREWRVFCAQVLRQATLAEDARFISNSQRTANRDALRDLIVAAFADLSIEQVTQRLEDAQIANARANDMAGVWAHPQLQARARWSQVDSPAGMLPALLPPASSNAFAPRMAAVPGVGQNTDAVLASLGYAPDQVAQFHASEVV